SAHETRLADRLLEVVRTGLADSSRSDLAWYALTGAIEHRKGPEQRAAYSKTSEKPLLDPNKLERFWEQAAKGLFDKCYKIDASDKVVPLKPGNELSLADLIDQFATKKASRTSSPAAEKEFQKALSNLETALGRSDGFSALKKGVSESVAAGFDPRLAGDLSTALGKATFKISSSIPDGEKTKVVYRDAANVEFEPGAVDARGFLRKNGNPVPLKDVRIEIHLRDSLDSRTLVQDVLSAQHRLLLDLTLGQRMQGSDVKKIDLPAMRQKDCHTHSDFVAAVDSHLVERMRPLREATMQFWKAVCDEHGVAAEFPRKQVPTDGDTRELVGIAMDRAIKALEKSGAVDKATIEYYKEIWRQYESARGLSSANESPAIRSFHDNFESHRPRGSSQEGQWTPPRELSKDELAKLKETLKKLGASDLSDPAAQRQFLDKLFGETRLWNENLKLKAERSNALLHEVLSADASARTLAQIEAHRRLGEGATPEKVNRLAEELVRGTAKDKPSDGSALDLALKDLKRVTREHMALDAHIGDVTTARLMRLETCINEFCRSKGMPSISLNLKRDQNASYKVGEGQISVSMTDLLNRSGGARLLSDLFHEVVHSQQDALVMRRIADKLGMKGISNAEEFKKFNEAYIEATGKRLAPIDFGDTTRQPSFVERVLELRDGKALTEKEATKADALARSFKENFPIGLKIDALSDSFRIAHREQAKLNGPASNRLAESLLARLTGTG
ncbi:MAG: hypothetical protein K2Z81_10120, partial [Cyanobacteria bacterium]|nr:hypothetical protein [Cyanobacteriota bacterium]